MAAMLFIGNLGFLLEDIFVKFVFLSAGPRETGLLTPVLAVFCIDRTRVSVCLSVYSQLGKGAIWLGEGGRIV